MENLFVIDIPIRKRVLRSWLVLQRDHGSDLLLLDLYTWYLEHLDGIPVEMASAFVSEVKDANERYTSGGRAPLVHSSDELLYAQIMKSPLFYFHKDYAGPVTVRS